MVLLVELVNIMAKVKRFEELECWREARDFVQLIYGLTKKDPFRKDFELPWTKNILVNLKLKRYRNKQKLYGKKSIISSLIYNVTQSKGIPKPIQPIELIKQG